MDLRTPCTILIFLAAWIHTGAIAQAQQPEAPTGLGVFLWWNPEDPSAIPDGDFRRISDELGARWVRFFIQRTPTEPSPGVYDFSGYRRLFCMLRTHGLRPMMILGGDFDRPYVRTKGARDEFMRWAAAAVDYVVNAEGVRNGVWESWNEPNCKPDPNVPEEQQDCWSIEEYILWARQLADEVFSRFPGQYLVGPSTGGTGDSNVNDLEWLEACFRGGLLEAWHGVSVHPYATMAPGLNPEDLDRAYRRLRELIDFYAAPGRGIPIISSEQGDCADFNPWGEGDWGPATEDLQSRQVARMNILNQANGVTLNLYYDWRDAAVLKWEYGDRWAGRCGLLRGPEAPDSGDDRKPAFHAVRTFLDLLEGAEPAGRLRVGDGTHLLRFMRRGAPVYAAWSVEQGGAADVALPLPPGCYWVLSHLGQPIGVLVVDENLEATLDLDDAPKYVVPR